MIPSPIDLVSRVIAGIPVPTPLLNQRTLWSSLVDEKSAVETRARGLNGATDRNSDRERERLFARANELGAEISAAHTKLIEMSRSYFQALDDALDRDIREPYVAKLARLRAETETACSVLNSAERSLRSLGSDLWRAGWSVDFTLIEARLNNHLRRTR